MPTHERPPAMAPERPEQSGDPWAKPFVEWTVGDAWAAWHDDDACQRDAHGCACPCHRPYEDLARPEQDEAVRLADAVLEANRRWPNETRWASLHREAFVSGAEWAGAALATPPPAAPPALDDALALIEHFRTGSHRLTCYHDRWSDLYARLSPDQEEAADA